MLYARATAERGGGTRIDIPGVREDVDAVGVAGQKRLVRIRASGKDCVDKVLAVSAQSQVPALHLDTDMESADLWFALDDIPDWQSVKATLDGDIRVLEGVGAVSVVGDGIGADASKLQKARKAARAAGIGIVAMSTSHFA